MHKGRFKRRATAVPNGSSSTFETTGRRLKPPRDGSHLTTRDTNNHLRSEQTAKTWRRLLPF